MCSVTASGMGIHKVDLHLRSAADHDQRTTHGGVELSVARHHYVISGPGSVCVFIMTVKNWRHLDISFSLLVFSLQRFFPYIHTLVCVARNWLRVHPQPASGVRLVDSD